MVSRTLSPQEVLAAAGISASHVAASRKWLPHAMRLLSQVDDGPALVVEALKALRAAETNQQNCEKASEAARVLEQMLHEMVDAHAQYYRLVSIPSSRDGKVAICRAGGQIRELPVHPDVDVERLASLDAWEYVRVHENVIVGVWDDDPYLFQSAQGDIVTFRDYAQADQHTVRVSRHDSDEHVVTLAGPLRDRALTPGTKLVLHRDQPHLAIAALPSQVGRNRFEISLDQIRTRLEDLAGLERVAERLIMDILKRIIYPDIQAEFDLDPLKGVLLLSRKPGMGKTSFVRAFVRFLRDVGKEHNFDLVVYHVKPNQTKSMWHGEDARIVREELFGVIRHRRDLPRPRTLLQLVIMDEVDSFGRRPGAAELTSSPAQAEGVEALLDELDGFDQGASDHEHAAHLLVFGLSNRPDRIDDALKRPGRLGDLVLELDALDRSGAEDICVIYVREPLIPWKLNGKIRTGAELADVRAQVIRPAVASVFPLVVLRYSNDTQRQFEVTAGEMMAGAHYRGAMNKAKQRAADRKLLGTGHPAVTYDDVVDSLVEAAVDVAAQMAADPRMLMRQLDVKVPVARVTPVPRDQLAVHPYLRVPSSSV